MTDTAQIRVVAAEEIESVGQLIAITFHDDPVTRWLVDDEPDRRRIMPPYFTMLAALGLKGGTVYASGDHQAAAVWIDGTSPEPPPPDEPEPELSELTGRYIDRFHTLERMLHRAQLGLPPHQHLFFLAARPGVQRRGLGTALLDAHHRRLDREGLPAYLDASSLESRRLYKRHGYQDVRQPFTFADGPSMWPMWRPPGGRGRVPD
ncbi:MAG TPA: GNAT family N-acetyltransferase [Kineosporiaceae bacterium]|nr:GNAT family N-acetyltransferase [Kineosporiaceae bacterium]